VDIAASGQIGSLIITQYKDNDRLNSGLNRALAAFLGQIAGT
jgi:hypothetical protein